MKLSDYVARFLASQGIKHVFAITGGASAHLIDSIARTDGIDYICPQHEQAAAMAADAYSRVTRNLGAAIATSGPGATNLLTGVACAYFDSIPVVYVTGQVATFRRRSDTGVRQLGFQETDVTDIFKPVTKYAVELRNTEDIRFVLEKAVHLARSDRPGPVLIDIPDDLQRTEIDDRNLRPFIPEEEKAQPNRMGDQVARCTELIAKAERPILILGWGIELARAERKARRLIEELNIPVAPTWGMMSILPSGHPLLVGAFGTHGTRHGNFAVQNADLVISMGARLDTREAGSPISKFAREAAVVVVDIDIKELMKFSKLGRHVDVLVHGDAGDFCEQLLQAIAGAARPDISAWRQKISEWKESFPICPPDYYVTSDVNPYVFIKSLSASSKPGDTIVVDTGCSVAWTMQAFDFKEGQKIYAAFNNTPMGYALPASVGASFALDKKPVICITGDGGLQMNIQEFATIVRHELPIKIFVMNNRGYSMIQQTQDQWFNSVYEAATVEKGLAFPDFRKVAEAYGIASIGIKTSKGIEATIREVLDSEGPVLCDVEVPASCRVMPQVKFGRCLEDSEPLLEREEFLRCMMVPPDEASVK